MSIYLLFSPIPALLCSSQSIPISLGSSRRLTSGIFTDWRYLSLPPNRQDLTQGLFYCGGFREEALLDLCLHRLTSCNVSHMSLQDLNSRDILRVRHVWLLIASKRSDNQVLCWAVNNVIAHPKPGAIRLRIHYWTWIQTGTNARQWYLFQLPDLFKTFLSLFSHWLAPLYLSSCVGLPHFWWQIPSFFFILKLTFALSPGWPGWPVYMKRWTFPFPDTNSHIRIWPTHDHT